MITQFSGGPSLSVLYGDDIGIEVIKAARQYGVSPVAVMEELKNNPTLLGASFADVAGAISSGVSAMAQPVASAIQTLRQGKAIQPVAPAPAPTPTGIDAMFGKIDPKMLIIPVVGIVLVLMLKKMKDKDKAKEKRYAGRSRG